MSYQVLYRTYRPKSFDEVVGQEYIVKTLLNAIKTDKIAHAYLFAGPRGTGKTTIAKLFAKAINCENFDGESCETCKSCNAYNLGNHPDIIEMDAASNNGVDDIRKIVEEVPYAPILGKYKVYIIDEVHMLTTNAFNALLKTLEEPPKHVIFILATTDPQKVIPTVLSRCQRYNFSKISPFEIKRKLADILYQEDVIYDDEALGIVASLADGGMRDALSIAEQILSYNPKGLFVNDIRKIYGLTTTEEKVNLLINIHQGLITDTITTLRDMYQAGIDLKLLAIDLIEVIKEAIIFSEDGNIYLLQMITPEQAKAILDILDLKKLFKDISILEELVNNNHSSINFLSYFEVVTMKMNSLKSQKEEEKVIQKLEPSKPVEEIIKPTEMPKHEEKVIEKEEPDYDLNFIARILLGANKEAKINDSIIYNRLDLFKLEPEKRKFNALLTETELFASSADAIIVTTNKTKASAINSRITNEELYNFLNEEFGIDKMIYAIDAKDVEEIIKIYRKLPKSEKPPHIEKYELRKNRTIVDIAYELFDNVTVE